MPTRGARPTRRCWSPPATAWPPKCAGYQSLGLGLVKHGFVVLTYDPAGQGERGIFYDPPSGFPRGHRHRRTSMVGIQSLLAGESIARYMVWDGMRAIDVLQSLPYVDPAKRSAYPAVPAAAP